MSREDDDAFELAFWSDCANTFGEETKQITYAHRMGLANEPQDGHWPVYDLKGKTVLDLGGGPASILLKCVNFQRAAVVDPAPYPDWVAARYAAHGVLSIRTRAETWNWWLPSRFDEAWLYNVLEHVDDPEAVVTTARLYARRVRIFEWLDMPPRLGHPHELHQADLERWLQGKGTVEEFTGENGCYGTAFYGSFSCVT